jgi:hypothetical protein
MILERGTDLDLQGDLRHKRLTSKILNFAVHFLRKIVYVIGTTFPQSL